MTTTEIALRPVTRENLRELTRLTVAAGQEAFLTPNTYSVAQAYVEPTWTPWGIFVGETAVGFAMEGLDPPTGERWIIRFMIGAEHQGKGYGTAALAALVRAMAERYGCPEIFLSYVPGNAVAERLYARAGFVPTGEVEDGEVVARLALAG
jgi:diamine N-acetyltransferase